MEAEKYYFVSFDAIIYKELPKSPDKDIGIGLDDDSEGDLEEVMKNLPGIKKNGKNVIPIMMPGHGMMYSRNGMFLPIEAETYFKFFTKADEIAIKFVRDASKEEFELDMKQRELIEQPKPLDYKTSQEIDDLIGEVERGRLNVHVDPTSEKNEDPFADLFKNPFDED